MAEDREAFRDLLDRIGQPYAPSWIVETAEDVDDRAARDRAAGDRPAGVHARRDRRRHRRRPRRPTASASAPACAPARSARSWSSAASSAGRRSSTRSCATPTTRASRCARWRTSTRSGVHTGDSIVVAPVQTLTDAVHQRLRSAALAIIRALGVEGGCNVQFALVARLDRVRGHRGQPARLALVRAGVSKATGYPIARVAAQIAVGRRLAEIPNVVTGTTVAAFEPALDYVVVKLPRFPFDKFPTADRTLGSQMKATGEVMAIDRTFGSALNKALRGLEQAGVGPLAEDPSWTPAFDYLAAVYAGDPDEDEPIRWVDDAGQACESTRFAQRSAAPIVLRRFLEPSDSRLWRLLGLLRRGVPEAVVGEATGISAVVPRRDGPERGLEREVARAGERLADPARRRAPRSCSRPPSARASATRSWPGWPARPPRRSATRGWRAASCRATRWSTRAPPSSPPRRPTSTRRTPRPARRPRRRPVDRPAALVIGSGPVRIGQGIEFDYCAVQAADTLRRNGWQAVMINSNPETVSTDFDASSRLYFEPLDPESVRSVIDAEGGIPAVVAFGGQTPLNLAAPLAAGGVALLGLRPRGHRPGRGAGPLRGVARPARHPAARGRHGPQRRGGADAGGAHRLPGHRPALVRDRRAGDRLLLFARGPRPASWRWPPSSTPTGRSGSTATSRASRSTSMPSATASRC